MNIHTLLKNAKNAKKDLILIDKSKKNEILNKMAEYLILETDNILAANEIDIQNAKNTISDVMIDRLRLDADRIKAMANGIVSVAQLDDPTGRVLDSVKREDGLVIEKISVSMGVIAIIYESRPNVTSDAAALCFKSGNVCILKSGKEAFNSSNAIVNALKKALRFFGVNENIINLVQDTTRESAGILMTANDYVDLLIPRGGAGLIAACVKNATVNCIQTGTGICHIYVDEDADIKKALKIIENAKTSRPSVCNAAEVLLVNKAVANAFLPQLQKVLCDDRKLKGDIPVQLRLDEKAAEIIKGENATEMDFDTEFLDYIMAVKVVDDVNEAVSHINLHSTGHSEAIISENEQTINIFTKEIDSAAVYVNASTRFTDGGEFGLGCEMGISTQKLHARGPMGLNELTTYKYIIRGNGHIR